MSFISWIFTHKLLILFIAGSIALGVSTITLAVQNADLREELDETSTTTTTTTTTKPEEPETSESSSISTSTASTTTTVEASTTTTTEATTPSTEASTTTTTEATTPSTEASTTATTTTEATTPSTEASTTTTTEATTSSTEASTTTTTEATTTTTTEATTPSTEASTTTTPELMDKFRLPKNVIPKSYELTLDPDLNEGLFKGRVNMVVEVKEDVKELRFHSKNLTITKVLVNEEENTTFKVDDWYELVLIDVELKKGHANVFVEFEGDLKNRIVGFYQSNYMKEDGKTVSIATTKFEPTYARQAFPCFDEPNMKAKFKIHIMKPKDENYIALSNMPELKEKYEEIGDKVKVSFEESVPMSTYLSAFIVSDFKHTETEIKVDEFEPIPFRVFATPAQVLKTEYAKDAGKKIMEFYLKYFNINYPLPKLDMVAVPDFVSGAMEHWGLVTFRETALLYDPKISSSANKQRVATVVAHELAHSWFGNYVTMDWWNDLWLNEGFASYIEYKGVDAAEPDWQMMDQFPIEDMHGVLKLDATLGSHPIVQKVETPDQITEIFDTISYAKGASVLRMLENAVTNETFKEGVTNYLNKYEYGNAVTENFLDELHKLKPELNIKDFMGTFTVQMGYPIVTVKRTTDGFELTQKRFLLDPDNEGKDQTETPYKYKWTIPITYITDKNNQPTLKWFNYDQDSILIEEKDADWIKINDKQVGYYRVNYDLENWKKLSNKLPELSIGDRSHLLEESFRIAESGQLPYHIPLDLTKNLDKEHEYIPWVVAGSALETIKRYLPESEQFKKYVVKIISKIYEDFGWIEDENEKHLTKRARVRVLDLACAMGHKGCLTEATNKFIKWLNEGEELSQDLRSLVYTYGMEEATEEEWNKVFDLMSKEIDAGEKNRLVAGLASVRNKELLEKLIDLAKNDTYIRKQDYFSCISQISANPLGTDLVWTYVRENWLALVDRHTLNDRYLGTMIPSITKTFSTEERKREMVEFFEKYPNAGAGAAARKQALETVENNIKWLKRNKEEVEKWLEENAKLN